MRIKDLRAGYHKKTVLTGVNLQVEKGEIISLIGPNGGGKSTLLRSISGELRAMGGAVLLEDQEIGKIPLKELARRMAIVNTDRVKPEHMSAYDVVLSGRLPYSDGFGLFGKEDHQAAKEACELMAIGDISDRAFLAMSDGQKQRTLIARAICQDPEYLVMDEPTSYLDIRHRLELMEVIKGLSARGVTIIMSLHELELALEISARCLLVKDDGTTLCMTPKEIVDSGVIQPLYGLSLDMYRKVRKQLLSVITSK
ncbi:ABC transporter ATP-binding protein [Butyrivibrio sp. DSM 10294]|uniref:ABC transporter ATP-binding protein n=1 Tax=Butyrivibrio sp. DSM 10294 TaxID=2972457 RepID=UPI00234FA3F5|nr:ABC transporter ATP-binding protein [Butyrivibrio sp. DSM 10294]MDC7294527.1 ABC transporter ATP-binding protein [Butyrivibrio sp. DSM 10294]